jgi:hypothetical protein
MYRGVNMEDRHVRFKSNDIGGELLPIITKGLYQDHLDSIREYIQNAIDANASRVRLVILSSSIIIEDDGDGMTRQQAAKSIRLGLSDKNPDKQVGFRGVGIFSSYDLCDELDIYTYPKDNTKPSNIYFKWNEIRGKLHEEQNSRMKGNPSRLSLEELLSVSIGVKDYSEEYKYAKGTKVVLSKVDPILMKALTNEDKVIEYIQNTIPLPFSKKFSHAEEINEWLTEAGLKTIRMRISIGGNERIIYRPYKDSMFSDNNPEKPIKLRIIDKHTKKDHGFAWVCFNGSNKYIPTPEIRGILLKKAGFSVGSRKMLEPLFPRVAFARRSTGEAILINNKLLPNAARNDFEPGPERDSLNIAFAELVNEISAEGAIIDKKYRVLESLTESKQRLQQINRLISTGKTTPNTLNEYSISLGDISNELQSIKASARKYDATSYDEIKSLNLELQEAISTLLNKAKRHSIDNYQREIRAARERDKRIQTEAPQVASSISELISKHELQSPEELLKLISLLDALLKSILPKSEYYNIIYEINHTIANGN